jgi:glycosyltransferase involved in cell wall biosynthesis
MPGLEDRTFCVNNCQDFRGIISKSKDIPIEYPRDQLNIITVARLSPEKGIIRALGVIGRIVGEGYNLRWHIIGGGPQKMEIEKKICQSNLSKHVFLYGNQENPYRYMKNADILFLPSFHEAAPMVFAEAKCLGLAIITTKTTSASDLVAEGREGFICENCEAGIYTTLKYILNNPNKLHECREYLTKQQFTNEKALLQFHSLINERM